MFDKQQVKRLLPLILFFVGFTVFFILFAMTMKYTFPFVAGFLLALATQPLIRWLRGKLHCRPWLASVLSTFLVYLAVLGILGLLGTWLVIEISNIITRIPTMDFGTLTKPINDLIKQVGQYFTNIDADFITKNQEQILEFAKSGMGIISTVLSAAMRFLTYLPAVFTMFIVMVFSTYFFSKDMRSIKDRAMTLLTKSTVGNIRLASHHGASMSGKYIGSYLLIYFLTFLETLIAFSLLGVPYPLLLSIITGVADVLPVLGPGTIYIPLAVIYACSGQWVKGIIIFAAWILITAIRQVIEPKIVSSSINIHPLWILAAIYFSLVAGNFWILIYVSLLLMLYQIFTQMGVLPRLFPTGGDSPGGAAPEKAPPPAKDGSPPEQNGTAQNK